MKISKKIINETKDYILVGTFSLIIDFLVYYLLSFYISPSISKKVSFLTGTTWSYFMNKKITFKSEGKLIPQLGLFILVYILSFSINFISHDFLIKYINNYVPFLVSTFLSIFINYIGQKFIVFKKK